MGTAKSSIGNLNIILLCLIYFSISFSAKGQQKFVLRGRIFDANTGEALIGSHCFLVGTSKGVASNNYGFYALVLDSGVYDISFGFVGYKSQTIRITTNQDSTVNIGLKELVNTLDEVTVSAEGIELPTQELISGYTLSRENVLEIPSLVGEPDLIKSLQFLPGIATLSEGSSAIYVRGGGKDQNLFLLDEAQVYNPSHLFGFYSSINPWALNKVSVFKGAIPARYGGRLSSVIDVRLKEGNTESFGGHTSLGLIASNLVLEGPTVKDKGSFMVSARRTYADALINLSPDDGGNNVNFYDFTGKVNFILGPSDRVYLSGYFGRDKLRFFDQYEAKWGNKTTTLRWNHVFGPNLFSNLSLIGSSYEYSIGYFNASNSFDWNSQVNDIGARLDMSYFPGLNSTFDWGSEVVFHTIEPGFGGSDKDSGIPQSRTIESAGYVDYSTIMLQKLAISVGLRYSGILNRGNTKEYVYGDNVVIDSISHNAGIWHSNFGLEPRLKLSYELNPHQSVELAYSRTRQYLQVIDNSSQSFTAIDIYLTSNRNIEPQVADQVSVGWDRRYNNDEYSIGLAVYYKQLKHVVDFVDHARLFQNPYIENELRSGNGESYGVEFLVSKNTGRFTGNFSFTYSKAQFKIPEINNNEEYKAPYDRPIDISVLGQYEISDKWKMSGNWVLASGRNITLPNGYFVHEDVRVPVYSTRNEDRLPTFHRLDISFTLTPRKGKNRSWKSEWVFGLYNTYFRKNPMSINFLPRRNENNQVIEPQQIEAQRTWLFPVIPSVTYNVKF